MGHYGHMRYDATANAIEATGLVKRFGKTTALDGVDLAARQGRVLGVLGPNGAGKTTAVRILATLLRPDSGQVSVCGYDVLPVVSLADLELHPRDATILRQRPPRLMHR